LEQSAGRVNGKQHLRVVASAKQIRPSCDLWPLLQPIDASEVRERVLEVIRSLLEELGSRGALPMLSGASQLDRDLGLGSLERVELLARLETAFGVRLPDATVAEANTPEDLAKALRMAPGAEPQEDDAGSALRAVITTQKLHREARRQRFLGETLLDVLRYRAMHDAERHTAHQRTVEGQAA
jgi:acyl carrier protein